MCEHISQFNIEEIMVGNTYSVFFSGIEIPQKLTILFKTGNLIVGRGDYDGKTREVIMYKQGCVWLVPQNHTYMLF